MENLDCSLVNYHDAGNFIAIVGLPRIDATQGSNMIGPCRLNLIQLRFCSRLRTPFPHPARTPATFSMSFHMTQHVYQIVEFVILIRVIQVAKIEAGASDFLKKSST